MVDGRRGSQPRSRGKLVSSPRPGAEDYSAKVYSIRIFGIYHETSYTCGVKEGAGGRRHVSSVQAGWDAPLLREPNEFITRRDPRNETFRNPR